MVVLLAQRAVGSNGAGQGDTPESSSGSVGDFDAGDFLLHLQRDGIDSAVLRYTGSQKNALVLYTRFMACPNCEPWLQRTLALATNGQLDLRG